MKYRYIRRERRRKQRATRIWSKKKNCISPKTNCIEKSRLCVKNRGYLLVLLIPWFIILAMRKISNLSTFSRQQCVKLRVHFPSVKSQHGMNEEECSPRALIETQPRFESQGTRCQIHISRVAARRRHWARWSLYWRNLQSVVLNTSPLHHLSMYLGTFITITETMVCLSFVYASQAYSTIVEDMNKTALEEYCNTRVNCDTS